MLYKELKIIYICIMMPRLSDRCNSYASDSVYHTAHVKMIAIYAQKVISGKKGENFLSLNQKLMVPIKNMH